MQEIKRIKLISIINDTKKKKIKFDNVVKEKWPQIPDHSYRILIIGGSGSGKTNSLLNLINHE